MLGRLEILTAISEQPGFSNSELQVPFDDEEDVLSSTAWASREHYERWLTASARDDILSGVGGLVADKGGALGTERTVVGTTAEGEAAERVRRSAELGTSRLLDWVLRAACAAELRHQSRLPSVPHRAESPSSGE